MKYELLGRNYAHIQNEETRMKHMELDFFATRMVEKVFKLLDFAGIELPTGLEPRERVFLFNDRTVDQSFFLEATEDKEGGIAYLFVSKFYAHCTYVSYSTLFRLVEE